MKNSCLLVFFIAILNPAMAQVAFSKAYQEFSPWGDAIGSSVIQNWDGGFFATGFSGTYPDTIRALVFRTDVWGDTLWTKRIAFGSHTYASGIVASGDNYVVVAGSGFLYDTNLFLSKLDQDGNIMWTHRYKDKLYVGVNGLIRTSDSGFLMCGRVLINTPPSFYYTAFLIKTDFNGDTLWTRLIDDGDHSTFECASAVKETQNGHYALCGYSDNLILQPPQRVLVAETDPNGLLIFQKTYSNVMQGQYCYANDLAITSDLGFMVVASADTDFTGAHWKSWLLRMNANGDTLWTRAMNIAFLTTIQKQNDNTYIICGSGYRPDSTDGKGYLSKIDSLGNRSWERFYGNFTTDFNDVQITSDSGFVVIGRTVYPDNEYLYLVKTDKVGLMTGIKTIGKNSVCLVYPNPAKGFCTVIVPPGTSWFGICNSVGNIIYSDSSSYKDEQKIPLNLERFSPGFYSLIAIVGDQMVSRRIIIQ